MHCETFLQTVVICSEKDSSSSISRPSGLTFITLVNKLPLEVISGLVYFGRESLSLHGEELGLFFVEWKPVGQCQGNINAFLDRIEL